MLEIRRMSADEVRAATSGGKRPPLEQSSVWEGFSAAEGNPVWQHLGWMEDGKTVAVATFYCHEMTGAEFLWARRGPVWLKEATPQREQELRGTLGQYVNAAAPNISFVRMHATYSAPDLEEPMRAIGYDRTIVINGGGGDRSAALALLPKEGRRTVNRAAKKMAQMGGIITRESPGDFGVYYELLCETAKRDGFTPHPKTHYERFLDLPGDAGRLYVARVDGQLAAWDLVGVNGQIGSAFYGASSQLSREAQAVPALDFEIACLLGEEGMDGLDLMGIHSPRTPSLFDVGKYKVKFAVSPIDVPGLWDLPTKPWKYRALVAARDLKRAVLRG